VATSPDAAAAARADAASGMWIVPALTWHRARGTREPLEALLARPELKFVAARERASWALAYGHSVALPGYPSRGAEETVAQMKRAGVRMLAGTGAGTPFVQPGASLHDELAALVAAGLTRYEALRAATRDAAEALGELASSGTIEAGKRADLVLVDANPILNLAALRTPSAVFLAGEWLTADALRARLETLAAANAAASRRFATFEPLAVSSGYRYARYELRLRGETIGEERLLVGPAADGGRELRSQCDVDGPGATSTELRANFDSQGRGTRVRFTRRAAGIDWSLEASRPPVQSSSLHPWEPTTVRVSGTLPALGSVSLDAIAASGATIAGPELAADLPFALVANFQLLADRVDAISLGTSRLIPLASLITRVEAFGARRVWRESVARVSRIEDATLATVEGSMSGQQFRVEISRPDGTGIERFQMSLGPDGLVHEVRDLDGGFVAKRVR
jgi:hypothetical protein